MITADQNPFRVQRIEAIPYRAPDFDWDAFHARLEAQRFRGAIVGPHGSGKTTLLLEAQAHLAARGIPVRYAFLNDATPRRAYQARTALRNTPPDAVLFLDGAEQLDPVTWHWLRWRTRQLRGFVITVHRPGRLPALHTTRTGETLLKELLMHLLPHHWEHHWPRAQAHFDRCHGNIREVFFALYDDCAGEV